MIKDNCTVLKADEHAHQHVGDEMSGCFYYEPIKLDSLAEVFKKEGKVFTARAARIEVRDTDAKLHAHKGAVVAFITSGDGILRTENNEIKINQGDILYIPENTPHLSIANKDTVMMEHIVYLGADDDWQDSIAV